AERRPGGGQRTRVGRGDPAATVRVRRGVGAGVEDFGTHRAAPAGLTGTTTHPYQQGLSGETAAATQPAGPTTSGGTGTIRRTTPAPGGSGHVLLHHGVVQATPASPAGCCHRPSAL